MQGQCGLPQLESVDPRDSQVNRFRLNMETVLGDSRSVRAQKFVGPRRPVAADDANFSAAAAYGNGQFFQRIVKPRVEMADIARAEITQEKVELGDCVGQVSIATAVDNVDPLAGMRMEQA